MMAIGKRVEISRRSDYVEAVKASLRQQSSLQGLRLMVSELEQKEQVAYQKHIADSANDQLREAWMAAKIAYDLARAGLEAKEAREAAQHKLKRGRR